MTRWRLTRFNAWVIDAATLSKLPEADKDALILSLAAQLGAALKLVAALQARIDDLSKPGKTPDNSCRRS